MSVSFMKRKFDALFNRAPSEPISVTDPATTTHAKIVWRAVPPLLIMHLGCLLVIWVGFSWVAFFVALFLYFIRAFALTGFYHRYFSHRAFKTSRRCQFIFALLGVMAMQRGPLWWASNHRYHHLTTDTELDPHSPLTRGFLWSQLGWFVADKYLTCNRSLIKDFLKYPELILLSRYELYIPLILALLLFMLGQILQYYFPTLATSGLQMLVWGYFISTVLLFHATSSVNTLAHYFGSKRFNTKDNSRNNLFVALISLGEGWHNNHHYYPISVRHGFYWYEIDITYYLLKLLEKMGLIWDLHYPSKSALSSAHKIQTL